MVRNFKTLNIWKRSRALVSTIYELTTSFPDDKKFGLTSQIRRASVSVPSNIAEGCGRGTEKDLSRFLDISIGSLCEVETQLYIASDLNFLEKEQIAPLIDETTQIRKMMLGYKGTLRSQVSG